MPVFGRLSSTFQISEISTILRSCSSHHGSHGGGSCAWMSTQRQWWSHFGPRRSILYDLSGPLIVENNVCVAKEFCLVLSLFFVVIKATLIPPFLFFCFRHAIMKVVVPNFFGSGRFILLVLILCSIVNGPSTQDLLVSDYWFYLSTVVVLLSEFLLCLIVNVPRRYISPLELGTRIHLCVSFIFIDGSSFLSIVDCPYIWWSFTIILKFVLT